MTDHIVVFEGNERLIGRTVQVYIEEATSFTLFGTVVTGEQIGVEVEREDNGEEKAGQMAGKQVRIGLPVIEKV
jgi:hypothetical protein